MATVHAFTALCSCEAFREPAGGSGAGERNRNGWKACPVVLVCCGTCCWVPIAHTGAANPEGVRYVCDPFDATTNLSLECGRPGQGSGSVYRRLLGSRGTPRSAEPTLHACVTPGTTLCAPRHEASDHFQANCKSGPAYEQQRTRSGRSCCSDTDPSFYRDDHPEQGIASRDRVHSATGDDAEPAESDS